MREGSGQANSHAYTSQHSKEALQAQFDRSGWSRVEYNFRHGLDESTQGIT
jgi:hypothetical protein